MMTTDTVNTDNKTYYYFIYYHYCCYVFIFFPVTTKQTISGPWGEKKKSYLILLSPNFIRKAIIGAAADLGITRTLKVRVADFGLHRNRCLTGCAQFAHRAATKSLFIIRSAGEFVTRALCPVREPNPNQR